MDQDQLPEDPSSDLEYDAQHCYRHPGRETGVSCGQCGRPICYECMIPAPVGFRCPECVAQQRRQSGRARVVTRSQMRGRWQGRGVMTGTSGMSVTKVLIGLNVAVFFLELMSGALGSTRDLVRLGGLVPAYVTLQHEYWRMLTSMFLHGGFLHLLFNMWALWVLGDYVESILGHVKYLLLYLISGLAGSVLVIVASPDYAVTVGASGAIFGIFGALALYAFLYRNRDFQARALLGNVIVLLVINLVISFGARGISWQGHIGGLIGGVALMAGYTLLGTKDPREGFSSGDAVVTGVALVVIATLTYLQVQSAAPLLLPAVFGS